MTYDELASFLSGQTGQFFIEVEGKEEKLQPYLALYSRTHPAVGIDGEGACRLSDAVDKWGLEFRLYVHACPAGFRRFFTQNTTYHPEYAYRLNDNQLIRTLLDNGYRLGHN